MALPITSSQHFLAFWYCKVLQAHLEDFLLSTLGCCSKTSAFFCWLSVRKQDHGGGVEGVIHLCLVDKAVEGSSALQVS